MIKYKIFITALLFFAITLSYGQNQIKALEIGDKVPDLILKHLLNQSGTINMNDLHQQDLLIINFWATWCVPCIKELPTLDSLSKEYKGRLRVLAVAYEQEKIVKAFFKKHSEIPINNLLIPMGDTILVQYFRHRVIPHNIWIDKNGIIKNITGQEEINRNKIAAFIGNGNLKANNKKDIIDFDMYKTFHLKDSDFIYRSIITGYTDGINGGTSYQEVWHHPTERWLSRFFTFNSSKQQIIWRALNRMNSFKDYYHILKIQTTDSTRFFWPKECPQSFANSAFKSKQDWATKNAFCYELTLPKAVKDTSFFKLVESDLERAFQISIHKENQRISVCVINIRDNKQFELPQNDSSFIDLSTYKLKVHNVQIIRLFQFLNEKVKPDLNAKPADPPFIDNTSIQHRVDLEITFDKEKPTYAEIKKALTTKYGFNFAIEEHDYPVFIVKDLAP